MRNMSPRIVLVLCLGGFLLCEGKVIQEAIFDLGPRLFDFYAKEMNNSVPENVIVSPFGLSLGLGLVELAGSQRIKRIVLDDFFDWKEGDLAFHKNLSSLQRLLKTAYKHKEEEEEVKNLNETKATTIKELEDVEVNVQSAVFHRQGLDFSPEFVQMIEGAYESQFVLLNQTLNRSDRQEVINNWARNATRNMIREFPAPETFDVLLANAVAFQGDWEQPFPSEYTRKGVFQSSPEEKQNATFLLGQLEEIPYYEDDHMKMVRLPYKSSEKNKTQDIGMFVLLPHKTKSLREIIERMSFNVFREVAKNQMRKHTVNVKLPKVSLRHRVDMKKVMERFGAEDESDRRWAKRDTKAANSTKNQLEDEKPAYYESFELAEFAQETVLEVNEKGTRAAALTGGTINYDGFKKNFRCDHPYLMLIYDNHNEVLLFWAAVTRPEGF